MSPLLLASGLSALVLVSPRDTKVERCSLEGTFLVVNPDGTTSAPKFAQVYVEEFRGAPRQPTAEFEMLQIGRKFEPHFLVVQQGDSVIFVNKDTEPHEVHAKAAVNLIEGKRATEAKRTDSKLFSYVGVTQLGCKLHKSMSAVILTVPSAVRTSVDPQGKWRLSGLPRKPLKVIFWAEGAIQVEKTLTPCASAPVEIAAPSEKPVCAHCQVSSY